MTIEISKFVVKQKSIIKKKINSKHHRTTKLYQLIKLINNKSNIHYHLIKTKILI